MLATSTEVAKRIVKEQALIIGPIAWEEAQKVRGLKVDLTTQEVMVEGSPREVLEKLVAQYERLFGLASRDVCREAVRPLISQVPPEEIPAVLR